MRRWGLNILYGFCVLLCIIILYSWARSYLPKNSRFESSEGRFYLVFWEGTGATSPAYHDPASPSYYGVRDLRSTLMGRYTFKESEWLGFSSLQGSTPPRLRYHIVGIPFWFLVLLTIPPAIISIIAYRRNRLRRKLGHCQGCGYDLRESRDKCPECGTAIKRDAVI